MRRIAAVATALVALISMSAPLLAAPSYVAAPPVYLNDAKAYRNIVEDGDFFVLMQPVLAIADWCAYLINTTGCADSPANPFEPTSFPSGWVFLNLYSDSGATLEAQVNPARIDYSLGGIYIRPGSTLTWPPTTWVACVETGPSAFDSGTATGACLTPGYNAALTSGASSEQRAQMGQDAAQMIKDIEVGRDLPLNSFVVSGLGGSPKVTSQGRYLALEALSVMEAVAPEIFQAASTQAFTTPYVPPVASGPLQTVVNAAADDLPGIGSNLGSLVGLAGSTAWTLFWVAIGFAGGIGLSKISGGDTGQGEPAFIVLGILAGALIGLWTGGPTIAAVGLTIFVLLVVAAFGIVRNRFPSTAG